MCLRTFAEKERSKRVRISNRTLSRALGSTKDNKTLRAQSGIMNRANELRNSARYNYGSNERFARNMARISRAEANMIDATLSAKGNSKG